MKPITFTVSWWNFSTRNLDSILARFALFKVIKTFTNNKSFCLFFAHQFAALRWPVPGHGTLAAFVQPGLRHPLSQPHGTLGRVIVHPHRCNEHRHIVLRLLRFILRVALLSDNCESRRIGHHTSTCDSISQSSSLSVLFPHHNSVFEWIHCRRFSVCVPKWNHKSPDYGYKRRHCEALQHDRPRRYDFAVSLIYLG